MLNTFLSVAAATVMSISIAQAAVFTQDATVSGSGAPDYTVNYLDFGGFDTSLGTLTGVTVQGSITVAETLTYSQSFGSASRVPVTLGFSLGGFSPMDYVSVTQDVTGTAVYLPGDTQIITVSGGATLTNALIGSVVARLAGGSGFAGTIATTVISPGSPISAFGTTNASATASYEYTPFGATEVPEPGTLALLGLAGVVPLLRRRRAQG